MSNYDSYPSPVPPPRPESRRLTRREDNKMVAGVCSGVAQHLNVDPNVVRLVLVATVIFGFGAGILLYLAGWWLMPRG